MCFYEISRKSFFRDRGTSRIHKNSQRLCRVGSRRALKSWKSYFSQVPVDFAEFHIYHAELMPWQKKQWFHAFAATRSKPYIIPSEFNAFYAQLHGICVFSAIFMQNHRIPWFPEISENYLSFSDFCNLYDILLQNIHNPKQILWCLELREKQNRNF